MVICFLKGLIAVSNMVCEWCAEGSLDTKSRYVQYYQTLLTKNKNMYTSDKEGGVSNVYFSTVQTKKIYLT